MHKHTNIIIAFCLLLFEALPMCSYADSSKVISSSTVCLNDDNGEVHTPVLKAVSVDATGHASHSALANGTWYRLTIDETGMYAVTTSLVAAMNGVSISNIAVYGQSGAMLTEVNSETRPDDLPELPSKIIDVNGNGTFDEGDKILFYAQGPDTWSYNSTTGRFERSRHAYANHNYVFLRTDATESHRVPSAETTLSANQPDITTYMALSSHEVDEVNTHNTGRVWLGERMNASTPQRTITLSLPAIVSGTAVNVNYAAAAISSSSSRMTLSLNSSSSSVTNFTSSILYAKQYATFIGNSTSLNFLLSYSYNESSATGYLDYIDVYALAPLSFTGGQMSFRSIQNLGSANIARFVIANASSAMQVWDVTAYDSVVSMPLTRADGNAYFCAATQSPREYIAFDGTSLLTPAAVASVSCQDLHGSDNADMVIVTNAAFLSQAQQLASLHSINDNLQVLVVTPEQVFNEFSSGKQDPMAIREMMRMFYQRSRLDSTRHTPRYLLLFGKASFDSRDILKNNLTTVVTYVSKKSFSEECDSYSSDDLFGYLDDNESGLTYESLELGIGRLPAKSSAEATLMVNKIEHYINRNDLSSNNVRGDWRNYITLLADDADPSQGGDTVFARSAENLSKRIANTYPQYNYDKIFADAYREQTSAIGSYYPDVNNALKQRLDQGTLLINYIGHGSPQYIGTERYVEFSDIAGYTNTDRLFFFVSSTCSYGHADMVDAICGAEALILAPAAAIGVISAGRPIAHVDQSNSDLCFFALSPANTIGDAIRLAKNNTDIPHCTQLFGDPALHLSLPQKKVIVTAINEKAVQNGVNDSAQVLSRVTVDGEIHDNDGTVMTDFDGTIYPIVLDRTTASRTLANDNEGTEVNFTQQNNVIYKGTATVTQGHFSYSFIVPRDVQYQYGYAKLSHYAKTTDGMDATGQYGNLMLGGFDENVDLSETRPSIRLFIGDSNFHNGGITGEDPYIYAILEDSIGINTAGCGLGHDITAVLDGNGNSVIVLNDFYETDITNTNRGYILYGLSDLTPGLHTLTLKAWNIYNYSASASIKFYVRSSDTTLLGSFRCTPNPATSQASLVLECNAPQMVNSVTIDIFDMQGRQVAQYSPTIHKESNTIGPAVWNLHDTNGREVTDGIYVARASVVCSDGNKLTSITKIVKIKQ
jgi:hypothetical protein